MNNTTKFAILTLCALAFLPNTCHASDVVPEQDFVDGPRPDEQLSQLRVAVAHLTQRADTLASKFRETKKQRRDPSPFQRLRQHLRKHPLTSFPLAQQEREEKEEASTPTLDLVGAEMSQNSLETWRPMCEPKGQATYEQFKGTKNDWTVFYKPPAVFDDATMSMFTGTWWVYKKAFHGKGRVQLTLKNEGKSKGTAVVYFVFAHKLNGPVELSATTFGSTDFVGTDLKVTWRKEFAVEGSLKQKEQDLTIDDVRKKTVGKTVEVVATSKAVAFDDEVFDIHHNEGAALMVHVPDGTPNTVELGGIRPYTTTISCGTKMREGNGEE